MKRYIIKLLILLEKLLAYLYCRLFKISFNNIIYSQHDINKPIKAIYVYDNHIFRWLSFGSSAIQSKVCKLKRDTPCLPVFNTMAWSSELYKQLNSYSKEYKKAKHTILIMGLGGGDLVRSFHTNLAMASNKNIHLDIIEISQDIIDIANKYFYLDKLQITGQIDIINTNAFDYLSKQDNDKKNIIVVDFFTEIDSALDVIKEHYIHNLYNNLQNNGILVLNTLFSNHKHIDSFISLIHMYFNENVLIISSPQHYNVIIFAFKESKYLDYIINNKNNYRVKNYINNLRIDHHHGIQAHF